MFEKLFESNGLSLDRLRSFLSFADAGSIAKAAPRDVNRQSQISRQISELETFFGAELTERRGKELVPSAAGDRLADPPPPLAGASAKEHMAWRTCAQIGRALYKLRQQTVDPVLGIIKSAMGFRQMSMRGREKASLDWKLVATAYNLKRLFNLKANFKPA